MSLSLKSKLIAGTALAVTMLTGYARRSYAAPCSTGTPYTYFCNNYYGSTVHLGNSQYGADISIGPGFQAVTPSGGGIYIDAGSHISITDYQNTSFNVDGDGVRIRTDDNGAQPGSVSINMNSNITAGGAGLRSHSTGTGDVDINFDGSINSGYHGIFVQNYVSSYQAISTGINTQIISQYQDGIHAINRDGGQTSITLSGNIQGHNNGVFALNTGSGIRFTSYADSKIVGYNYGISVALDGTGILSADIGGTVRSVDNRGVKLTMKNGDGIFAVTGENSSILSQKSAGLHTSNRTGYARLIVYGDIEAYTRGIQAYTGQDSTTLNLLTGRYSQITSGQEGIYVYHYGQGQVDIDLAGKIYSGQNGVNTKNSINSTAGISITTRYDSNIQSYGNYGIWSRNYGTGNLSIDVSGNISSDFTGGAGIIAENDPAGNDLTITTGIYSYIRGYSGIHAIQNGLGALEITALGDIYSNYSAISATNAYSSYGIKIYTGSESNLRALNAYSGGIVANNLAGNIDIDVQGVTQGGQYGIRAYNSASASDLLIQVGIDGSVTGDTADGINAKNYGTGSTEIKITGDVTGNQRSAIRALNANDGDLYVSIGQTGYIRSVYGYGIYARNQSAGGLLIYNAGEIISGSKAIYAINSSNSHEDFEIYTTDSSSITAAVTGIEARNYSGELKIHAGGDIEGGDRGITAYNSGTNLVVSTSEDSSITGDLITGISLRNFGTGYTSLIVDGEVTGKDYGVYVSNSGSDLTVNTGAHSLISSSNTGISVRNGVNTGALSINAEGDITGTNYGIKASNYGTTMSLETGNDSVITGGIFAINRGSGGLTIKNHGTLIGRSGLNLINAGGASTGLINSGVIEGTDGTAISFFGNGSTSYSTTATPIEIAGGRIIGNVTDSYNDLGFSPVTVTGAFTSEGDFKVSGFNVSAAGDFTLGDNNNIDSYNGVQVNGKFTADGVGASSKSGPFSVNGTGQFHVNEDFSIHGDFYNNGKTHIATGKQLSVDTMAAGAAGDLYFGFNTTADHALLTVTNGAADLTNQTLHIDVTGVTGLATNEQALLISGTGAIVGGPGGTAASVDDNSVLWDFRIVDGTGSVTPTSSSDLFLIAAQSAPVSQLANTANNAAAGDVLMSLQNTANPELSVIVGNMNGASTEAEFNEILEATQPGADMSEAAVMMGFSERMMDTVSDRLNTLREGDMGGTSIISGLSEDETPSLQKTGVQAWAVNFGDSDDVDGHGAEAFNSKEWQSAFGRYSRQKEKDGIDGYEATAGGLAIGIDTGRSYNDMILGLAVSYAHTSVNAFNANRSETEIDGYQILFYGTKILPYNSFVNFMASYGQNQNDTTRHDVGGTPGLTAKGDFTSRETGLSASVGRHIAWNDYSITPSLNLAWLHYTADGYTETGAGGASLVVDTNSLDSVEIGPSIQLSKTIRSENGATFLPEIHAGYSFDLSGDPLQKTAQFTGGGAAFTTQSPDPARHRFNVGLGIGYSPVNNWDYSLTYDFDAAQGFQSHALMAKAAWKF